jgi:hypothetical protein
VTEPRVSKKPYKGEPATFTKDEPMSLVRWTHTADGWISEVVDGYYVGRDREAFRIRVDGVIRSFPRPTWQGCKR